MQEEGRKTAVQVIDMINRLRDQRGLRLIICVYKCPVRWSYTDWTCANIQPGLLRSPPLTKPVHRSCTEGWAGRRRRSDGAGAIASVGPVGRRLMLDKSATALTAEYPRVAGRRDAASLADRTDGPH